MVGESSSKYQKPENFDCVGYKSNLTNLRFRTDYGDPELTKFLQLATEGYLKKNWTTSECGYACSDHASWDSFGFVSLIKLLIVTENFN